jgi:Tat protein translocase TatB subunit
VFSVSPAEMLTIAVIALVVFGPRRLPEIARKAGSIFRQVRDAAAEMRTGIEAEYEEDLRPLSDVRRQMSATLADLEDGGSSRYVPDEE